MLATVLFYAFSLVAVASAVGVIAARSAVYSTLLLVLTLCSTAGLFALQKAYLVATILVLVYAGAILVLFLFVVMLVDVKSLGSDWRGRPGAVCVALGAAGLFLWQALSVIGRLSFGPVSPAEGTAAPIGRLLFDRYVLPFELTAFLILAAVVAVVVLAKKEAS